MLSKYQFKTFIKRSFILLLVLILFNQLHKDQSIICPASDSSDSTCGNGTKEKEEECDISTHHDHCERGWCKKDCKCYAVNKNGCFSSVIGDSCIEGNRTCDLNLNECIVSSGKCTDEGGSCTCKIPANIKEEATGCISEIIGTDGIFNPIKECLCPDQPCKIVGTNKDGICVTTHTGIYGEDGLQNCVCQEKVECGDGIVNSAQGEKCERRDECSISDPCRLLDADGLLRCKGCKCTIPDPCDCKTKGSSCTVIGGNPGVCELLDPTDESYLYCRIFAFDPPGCEGKSEGSTCKTLNGDDGICKLDEETSSLYCEKKVIF